MSRAWLITGSCTDDDQRTDTWNVCAFTNQQRAESYLGELTDWLNQTIDLFNARLTNEREGIDPKDWEAMNEAYNRAVRGIYEDLKPELDPWFRTPYAESSATNSYKLEEVKLDTRVMLGVKCH